MPLSFLIGCKYAGVIGLCLGWVVGYTIVFFITLKLSLPLIDLSILNFLSQIAVAFSASCGMTAVLFGIKYLLHSFLPMSLTSCILIIIGIMSYPALVFRIKKEAFHEVWSLIPGNAKIETFMKNVCNWF